MILENIVVKVISMREKSSIQIATWLTSGYMWGENFVHWDGHYDEVGKSIDELSLGGNDGVVTHLWTRSCSAFNNQQGFPNSILVLVILKSDLALPHVWLEKRSGDWGKGGVWIKHHFFSKPKVSEWNFFPSTTFFYSWLKEGWAGPTGTVLLLW